MSLGTHAAADSDGAQVLLSNARFELMPFESFEEEITHLPDGATVAITTSPQLGIDTTVDRAEQAASAGYEVVPHIAARYVEDRDHLDEIATRLAAAGITDVFVPGGDREEPAGEFESSHQLLVALDELGHEFEEVGITGYPEGHYFLDDETLAESMANKEPYATYITTQLCYDPEAVVEWIEGVRDRGVELPIEVGIPGVMKYQRLLQISKKVGVGESMKFLKKTTGILGFVRQLVGSRGKYQPDALIDGLAPYVGDERYNIRGIHIYSMNQTEDLESWRRGRLEE